MDKINWKKDDFEIRTSDSVDGYPYVELVKWTENDDGRKYCYVVAYFHRNNDGDYTLHFVGDRPFTDIAEMDIAEIWKELFLTQIMLSGGEE